MKKFHRRIRAFRRLIHFLAYKYSRYIIWQKTREMTEERKEFAVEKERIRKQMNKNFQGILKQKETNWKAREANKEERWMEDITELTIQKNKAEYLLEEEKKQTREAYLGYTKAAEVYKKRADILDSQIAVLDRFQTLIVDATRAKNNLMQIREESATEIKNILSGIFSLEAPAHLKAVKK